MHHAVDPGPGLDGLADEVVDLLALNQVAHDGLSLGLVCRLVQSAAVPADQDGPGPKF